MSIKTIKAGEKRTVAIATLGCKVNQYESASFLDGLEERGLSVVPFSQPADIYIINTCAVTAKAGAQSRQYIRRAVRTNPGARVVVTGCYAQVASQDILELAEQSICIVGNGFKQDLAEVAAAAGHCDLEMHMGDISRPRQLINLPVRRFGDRTRAYLKIQDGCDRFCSYCIVPYARGRSRSLPPEKALAQARVFAGEGYRELVITGIHAGVYGHDLEPRTSLFALLNRLLEENLQMRYRISSLEPMEITAELLQLMENSDRIMPHLHIPLQSGDDRVLKKMNRRYTADYFAEVVEKSVGCMPDVCIGVDVLVGFPGEDEKMFQNTVALLECLPVAYLHVFPFSKRPGTVAAGMPEQMSGPVKEERVRVLRELDRRKRKNFYEKQLGNCRQVLVESKKSKSKLLKGFTDNYVPVYFAGKDNLVNNIVEVKIERLADGRVMGALI